MSHENESCLRFSLEESVWFQKGQEVAELVSISLDPNITIHENDQYVTIKGALQLTGEYKRHEDDQLPEELLSAPKFVQSVEDRGEGICEFSHRFPVDITIPNNRIQSVYDINVEVESFDYVFPERSCMKLTADLTITGLYGDQQHVPVEEQVEFSNVNEEELEEERQEIKVELEPEPLYRSSAALADVDEETDEEVSTSSSEDLYTPFEAEARKQPEVEEEVKEEVLNAFNHTDLSEAPTLTVNEGFEHEELKVPEVKEQQTPEISFAAQRKETSVPVSENKYRFADSGETKQIEVLAEVESESSSSSSSSSPQPKAKKKKSSKKGLSLTEFFARKEEVEDLTKLRMCIVQHGDTLNLIAERYDVTVQQLLKVNHLEVNKDVYEGQVLYIPVVVAQN